MRRIFAVGLSTDVWFGLFCLTRLDGCETQTHTRGGRVPSLYVRQGVLNLKPMYFKPGVMCALPVALLASSFSGRAGESSGLRRHHDGDGKNGMNFPRTEYE
jgi:hypothetical protein